MMRDISNDIFMLKAKENITLKYSVMPKPDIYTKTIPMGTIFYGSKPFDDKIKTTPDGQAPNKNLAGQVWVDVPMDKVEIVSVKSIDLKKEVKTLEEQLFLSRVPLPNGRLRTPKNNTQEQPLLREPTLSNGQLSPPKNNTQSPNKAEKNPFGLIVALAVFLGILYYASDKKSV